MSDAVASCPWSLSVPSGREGFESVGGSTSQHTLTVLPTTAATPRSYPFAGKGRTVVPFRKRRTCGVPRSHTTSRTKRHLEVEADSTAVGRKTRAGGPQHRRFWKEGNEAEARDVHHGGLYAVLHFRDLRGFKRAPGSGADGNERQLLLGRQWGHGDVSQRGSG